MKEDEKECVRVKKKKRESKKERKKECRGRDWALGQGPSVENGEQEIRML